MRKMLTLMPHGQAFVTIHDDGKRVLTSYKTEVAEISADNWLTIKGWQSPTTRKHIAAFVDEYVHGITDKNDPKRARVQSYQTAHGLYDGHIKLDITTGEVKDL